MLKDQIARVDSAVAKYFIGNTTGFYCELGGRAGNRAFAASKTPAASTMRQYGAVPFDAGFDSDDIASLTNILDAFEKRRDYGSTLDNWMLRGLTLRSDTVRLSAEPEEIAGTVRDMEAKVQAAVEHTLGLPVERLGITLYRNRNTQNVKVLSADWHFDRRPTDWMRAFVYLSNVDEDCGPFHYYDRDASTAFCRKGFSRQSPTWQKRVEAAGHFTRLVGPAGSGLLANAERILHRAGNPQTGRHRDMFEFIFRPQT